VGSTEQRIAGALDGDAEALARLACDDAQGTCARQHRVGSALYLQAYELGVEGSAPAAWRQEMMSLSARYMIFDETLVQVSETFDAIGVDWIPLKGYDLGTRVYQRPEERMTSDLDLLILEKDFERARQALRDVGWRGVATGPRAQRYLTEEGYAWQAVDDDGVLLELHFRLWGSVPSGLADAIFKASAPDPSLPLRGRRLRLHHAYLIAAVHTWLSATPRGVGLWRDLERLATTSPSQLVRDVIDSANHWKIQLPVLLASEIAGRLWNQDVCRSIASELEPRLRLPERLALAVARRGDPGQTSLGLLSLARLASARSSRHGWRMIWRRLWAHPGIVETATEPGWPWLRRRVWYQLTTLGWTWAARRLENLDPAKKPDLVQHTRPKIAPSHQETQPLDPVREQRK